MRNSHICREEEAVGAESENILLQFHLEKVQCLVKERRVEICERRHRDWKSTTHFRESRVGLMAKEREKSKKHSSLGLYIFVVVRRH